MASAGPLSSQLTRLARRRHGLLVDYQQSLAARGVNTRRIPIGVDLRTLYGGPAEGSTALSALLHVASINASSKITLSLLHAMRAS